MSKKLIALFLAFALVFSTVTVAFAEEATIGADAQIVTTIGMLQGDGNGVTPQYVSTQPTRMQAAIMYLRLKGLEAEALAFTGTENFTDGNIAWAGGKAIMAYLKANPQHGWIGSNGNFKPNEMITAQQYYKVMLEALGYKQTTATVVGDFDWNGVIAFAAGKGLTKSASVAKFTVNDLAIATVEALKANVKDANRSLVASLVQAGKIDRTKATSTGIFVEDTTTDAKMTSVKAIANDKLEVTFNAAVAKAFAENAANYKVVVKGSTTALEVKSAVAESETVVAIETAAQTAGTAYTMTVGAVSMNFAGIAKQSAAPEVDTVKSIDTNTVEVVFTKAMDKASAENVANYTIDKGATVKKVEIWTSQDETRKTVRLTAEGLNTNNIYKLTIQNVKSSDMVAIKTVSKSFSATADTKAPTVDGNIIVKNNQRIVLNFTDTHGIDKATAENIANYSLDNGLTITKITAKDAVADAYDYLDQIEIDTTPMEVNKRYTLTINNLADGSVSKNVISKAITKQFGGVSADKTAPKAGAITVYGDSMVEIAFTETNRLDAATVTDIANYSFDNGLQVLKAEIVRASKPDTALGKTVVLTTSTMDEDTTYKITIENIADEFGNVIAKVSNRSIERSTGADIKPPTVTKAVWNSLTEVELTFDERLNVETANDPANYTINNSLGAILKAEVSASDDYKVVTITTAKQKENTNYTITINGVKDRLGNAMASAKAYFTSQVDGADTTRPEIESITAVNNREIRVTFNEAVTGTSSAPDMTIQGGAFTANIVGVIDDETTVVLKTNTAILTTNEITVTALNGIKDKHNNAFVVDADDLPTFYGSTTAPDAVEVSTKDQVDVRTLQFTFDGPIKIAGGATQITAANGTVFDAYVDVDDDASTTPTTTEALSTLTLVKNAAGVLPVDTEYKFDFSTDLTDYLANAITDEGVDYATFTTYKTQLEDKDAATIDYVEAVSTNKVNVVFTEAMSTAGTYEIKKSDGTASGATITAAIDGTDKNVVNLTLGGTALVAGDVYKLIPKTGAKDVAGNISTIKDVSFEFVASAVTVADYIKGVKITDAKNIKVYASRDIAVNEKIQIFKLTAAGAEDAQVFEFTVSSADDMQTLALTTPLMDGTTYGVKVVNNAEDTVMMPLTKITGISVDGGIDVDDTNDLVTFSGWDTDNYTVTVVYDENGNGAIAATEIFTVTAVAGEFVMSTVYQSDDTPLTFDDITTGATYVVEVRRTISDLNLVGTEDLNAYQAAIAGKIEGSVLYSKEFTK